MFEDFKDKYFGEYSTAWDKVRGVTKIFSIIFVLIVVLIACFGLGETGQLGSIFEALTANINVAGLIIALLLFGGLFGGLIIAGKIKNR